jgi:hypothetical protein
LSCTDVIEWITRKIDHQHRSILNAEGKDVANYKPSLINQIYHLKEATVKISPDWFKQKSESADMLTILKGWWSEGNFRSKPTNVEWKTSKFRKTVQIIVILLSRLFGRKDGSTFPDKWIPIIYQIMTSGATLNWGELISSNLDNQLKRVHKEHQFYMSTYLMDVMCANLEFPSLEWKWEPSLPSVHVYCKMLWENKYKEYYDQICNKFISCNKEENDCMSYIPYANISLMYVMKWSRLYISHAVGIVIKHMENLRKEHWVVVKWVLRYLGGTSMYCITYNGCNMLTGEKIPRNKGGHCPFRKSQLDSRTFGMAGPTGLWTRYHLGGDLNRLSSTKKKSTS